MLSYTSTINFMSSSHFFILAVMVGDGCCDIVIYGPGTYEHSESVWFFFLSSPDRLDCIKIL